MKAKVLFCVILLLSFSDALSAAANQKPCTTSEEKQALNEADSLKDWDALHRSFIRFGHCDDGAIAEGYSDTVGRLLARDWKHIGTLGKLLVSDKKFESFVLRHIDETLPTDTLKAIANNAEKNCPADETTLCRKILQSIQAAGSPLAKPSDFGRPANDEENYSDSLVVAPLADSPKYLKYKDGRQQVVYVAECEYPAEDVLSFISAELQKRGWKPLPHDFLNADIPSSHQRGWGFFEDHTRKPWTGVYTWMADWEDGSHDIVRYALEYEAPDNSTRNLKNLQVIALFIPVDIVAKMKRDAVKSSGESVPKSR